MIEQRLLRPVELKYAILMSDRKTVIPIELMSFSYRNLNIRYLVCLLNCSLMYRFCGFDTALLCAVCWIGYTFGNKNQNAITIGLVMFAQATELPSLYVNIITSVN